MLTGKLYFLDQLWKFTEDNQLVNKSGEWIFTHKKWKIPCGCAGFIKDLESDFVLGLDGDNKNQVTLQDTRDQTIFAQKWIRSKQNHDGWFTLQNSGSKDYLAVVSNNEIITSGKITVTFYPFLISVLEKYFFLFK